jgi:hypothetical protein
MFLRILHVKCFVRLKYQCPFEWLSALWFVRFYIWLFIYLSNVNRSILYHLTLSVFVHVCLFVCLFVFERGKKWKDAFCFWFFLPSCWSRQIDPLKSNHLQKKGTFVFVRKKIKNVLYLLISIKTFFLFWCLFIRDGKINI